MIRIASRVTSARMCSFGACCEHAGYEWPSLAKTRRRTRVMDEAFQRLRNEPSTLIDSFRKLQR